VEGKANKSNISRTRKEKEEVGAGVGEAAIGKEKKMI
jgi:hypothetical protein